jgi:hypothetical protein
MVGGVGLGLYCARYFDESPHFDPRRGVLAHARLSLLGATANAAWGNWIGKLEIAQVDGLRFAGTLGRGFRRHDVLLGLEYGGIRDATAAVEFAARRIDGFEEALALDPREPREVQYAVAIRFERSLRRDRVRLRVSGICFGSRGRDGAFIRASMEYVLRDGLSGELGLLIYRGGERVPFSAFADNDRLFARVRYKF